jgi:hypothetical protein
MKKFVTLILGFFIAGIALAVVPKEQKEKKDFPVDQKATLNIQAEVSAIANQASDYIVDMMDNVRSENQIIAEAEYIETFELIEPEVDVSIDHNYKIKDDLRKPTKGFSRIDIPLSTHNC